MRINIGDNNNEQSISIKLLSVKVDEQLNFNGHISELCKRTNKHVVVLMRLRNLIPEKAKLQIYKPAILPYLTYCHLSWYFCQALNRRKLEQVQELALQAVFNAGVLSYEQLLTIANLLSLYNRRLQGISQLIFKVRNNLVPSCIRNLFSSNADSKTYNLRNSDFKIPRFNTFKYGYIRIDI